MDREILVRQKNRETKEVRTINDNLTREASVARDRRWIDSEESMGQDMTLNICETMNGTEVLVARDRRCMDPKERMNRDTTRLKICEIEMEKSIDQRPMREALVVQDKPRKETNDLCFCSNLLSGDLLVSRDCFHVCVNFNPIE